MEEAALTYDAMQPVAGTGEPPTAWPTHPAAHIPLWPRPRTHISNAWVWINQRRLSTDDLMVAAAAGTSS